MMNLFAKSIGLSCHKMYKSELKSLLTQSTAGTPSGRIVRVLSERGALSGTRPQGWIHTREDDALRAVLE